jgi:hypothetical protein
MRTLLCTFFVSLLLAVGCGQQEAPVPKQGETLIAAVEMPVIEAGRFVISPDCRRIACLIESEGGVCVALDGKKQKRYDEIARQLITFSPDSKRLAYPARAGD